jgi:hypothetical protein
VFGMKDFSGSTLHLFRYINEFAKVLSDLDSRGAKFGRQLSIRGVHQEIGGCRRRCPELHVIYYVDGCP